DHQQDHTGGDVEQGAWHATNLLACGFPTTQDRAEALGDWWVDHLPVDGDRALAAGDGGGVLRDDPPGALEFFVRGPNRFVADPPLGGVNGELPVHASGRPPTGVIPEDIETAQLGTKCLVGGGPAGGRRCDEHEAGYGELLGGWRARHAQ